MTPDLSQCGVAGIMRTLVLELAGQLGLVTRIVPIGLEAFLRAEEVFLTNSLIGIWPVIALGEMSWRKGRVTLQLQEGLAHSSNSNSGWHE